MRVHVSVCVHVKDEEHWYMDGQKCAVSSPMLVEEGAQHDTTSAKECT